MFANSTARRAAVLAVAAGLVVTASAQAEIIYGLTASQSLVTFDSNTRTLASNTAVSGFTGTAGEALVSIDVRPATGQVYALSNQSNLYTVNTTTGALTKIGATIAPSLGTTGLIDFNPTVDRIRTISTANDTNLRVNPDTGAVTVDTSLTAAATITDISYINNTNGATTTTLYGIDSTTGRLVTIAPPNNGQVNQVGASNNFSALTNDGFDTSGITGISYVADSVSGATTLYALELGTGTPIALGPISGLTSDLLDITVFATVVPEPTTLAVLGLGGVALLRRKRV